MVLHVSEHTNIAKNMAAAAIERINHPQPNVYVFDLWAGVFDRPPVHHVDADDTNIYVVTVVDSETNRKRVIQVAAVSHAGAEQSAERRMKETESVVNTRKMIRF